MIFVRFRRFDFVQYSNRVPFSISSLLMNLKTSMKTLIDKHKYQEALTLFDQNPISASNTDITLALKACAKLKNLERGKTIHQYISSRSINDSFLNTSLIHLYSR
jgi:hypothetical protein